MTEDDIKKRRERIRGKAEKIVSIVQGMMALEGQGLDKEEIDAMIERTYQELTNG